MINNNAANNDKLIKHLINILNILREELNTLSRVSYLLYIIQLTLKNIIIYIKIKSQNNKIITE